jgi:transcriptional regulator with XRE-family HTH domain
MVKVRVNERVLWDYMLRNNLSQRELALGLGISPSYLSQLICGVRHPSPKLRRCLLDKLELSFDELFKSLE